MSRIEFHGLPIMIGNVPYTEATLACEKVLHYLKEMPTWPQLPRRSFQETMYTQFSEGFPGITVTEEKVYVDRAHDLETPLERLYTDYYENNYYKYAISQDYAAGLHQFITYEELPVRAVKGQITGPVSWAMTVADNDGKAIAGDKMLTQAAAQLLKLKAAWMEEELRRISKYTLILVDEPCFQSIGEDSFNLTSEKVVSLIREVYNGIRGLKGIHCDGKPDWATVLKTHPDVLSLDAYSYAQSLLAYPREVRSFIAGGGVMAWGIVPNEAEALSRESTGSLQDRLEETISPLTRQGYDFPFRQLIAQSLITPSNGLASLSSDGADRALELLADLSIRIRGRWG